MAKRSKYTLFEWLWLGAPVAIWFAYQPLFRLGQDGTMYFELSITMLYVAIMALASLPSIWHHIREIMASRMAWVVTIFVLISIMSIFWTMNMTRGILTVGVTGMLYAVFLGAVAERARLHMLMSRIIRVYIGSALVMCGLALVQFFAGIWLDASTTLLCAGCVAEQFGFARPNVFLIEPQFLGSALLPAALLLTRQVVLGTKDWRMRTALFIVMTVLVLTLSRGALLAFIAGLLVLWVIYRHEVRRWFLCAGLGIASLGCALILQGTAAVLNPQINETFRGAVAKSIHQLTMGVVDVREAVPQEQSIEATQQNEDNEPHFDGYVAESTDARMTRTELALRRWRVDISTMLFGVGIGSAGMAIHEMFPDELGAREIVQNEYVEVLLERGIIGFMGFLAVLGGLFVIARKRSWCFAIIVAFMVQWLFFSGYPNALHIYLIFSLLAVATLPRGRLGPATRY